MALTTVDPLLLDTQAQYTGFKNRLINGNMAIDQRNAGAAVTINSTANTYTLDRWVASGQVTDGVYTIQQSTTAPTGFKNSLLVTVTTADASIGATQAYLLAQFIEGLNTYDLAWGTSSAASVTLSFWVRSSVTGTFGGVIQNSALNRSYPFSFTVNSANTNEYKTVTIPGDTSGTWLTDTGRGLVVRFSFGVGSTYKGTADTWAATTYFAPTGSVDLISTLGATFYVTGVQLEKGTQATSFDYRPYGTELQLCQRYYYKIFPNRITSVFGVIGYATSTTTSILVGTYPVTLRTEPTTLEQSGTAGDYATRSFSGGIISCSSVPTYAALTNAQAFRVNFIVAAGLTAGQSVFGETSSTGSAGYLAWSAEL